MGNHTERDWTPPTTSSTTTRTTSVRTTTTSSWTSAPSRLAPTVSEMRGCVSTTVNCTTDIDNCRTFSHGKVAKIFCQCLPKLCLECHTSTENTTSSAPPTIQHSFQ